MCSGQIKLASGQSGLNIKGASKLRVPTITAVIYALFDLIMPWSLEMFFPSVMAT